MARPRGRPKNPPPKKRYLSTGKVANYCSVSPVTIVRWIKDGKLKAIKTPGGHNRVEVYDFLSFLKGYKMPIDDDFFRKLGIPDSEFETEQVANTQIQ